jgi:hypothetical protein
MNTIISIPALSVKSWSSSAQACMNLAKKNLFSINFCQFTIGINYSMKNRSAGKAVYSKLAKRSQFLLSVESLISLLDISPVLKEVSCNSIKDWGKVSLVWEIEIPIEKVFSSVKVETEKENFRFIMGPDLHGLGMVALESDKFIPQDWYKAYDFGNEFNGGTTYEPENAPESIPLPEGYSLVNKGSGHIDGWGFGFKGGSYIYYQS